MAEAKAEAAEALKPVAKKAKKSGGGTLDVSKVAPVVGVLAVGGIAAATLGGGDKKEEEKKPPAKEEEEPAAAAEGDEEATDEATAEGGDGEGAKNGDA